MSYSLYSSKAMTGPSRHCYDYYLDEHPEIMNRTLRSYFYHPATHLTVNAPTANSWQPRVSPLGSDDFRQAMRKYLEKGTQADLLGDPDASVYSYVAGKTFECAPKATYKRFYDILKKTFAASRSRTQSQLQLEYWGELHSVIDQSEDLHERYHYFVDKKMSGDITGAENLEFARLEAELDASDEGMLAQMGGSTEWRAKLESAVEGIAELNHRLEMLISRL